MGRYTDFSLYWEHWGGYADRPEPFQEPELVRVLASPAIALVTRVWQVRGSGPAAETFGLPQEFVASWRELLAEIEASDPLVTEQGDGAYVTAETLSGVSDGKPFHVELVSTESNSVWTPLGERVRDALSALREAAGRG
jgi:ketosteroid isomerase-like protein